MSFSDPIVSNSLNTTFFRCAFVGGGGGGGRYVRGLPLQGGISSFLVRRYATELPLNRKRCLDKRKSAKKRKREKEARYKRKVD